VEAARRATAADVDRIAELFRLAMRELEPTRGGRLFALREARSEPVETELLAALTDDRRGLWAGTIDDVVIGYAATHVEDLREGYRLGVIDDLFVEPGARGVGVGEALMGELLEWGEEQGCGGLDTTALPGNRATKNFFEGSGFTARLLVMHHTYEGAPEPPPPEAAE
jgi:GNAT superfamily N-acetyltransferase